MGYLFDNLPKQKEQIVECPKLYKYILRVKRKQPPLFELAAAETDGTISMIIKGLVPDVEEWQYVNTTKYFHHFRFHLKQNRTACVSEFQFRGIYTETEDEP